MGFLMSAILARILSPTDMGTFFIANNVAIFLALNCRFGIDTTLLSLVPRELSNGNTAKARELISLGVKFVGLTSITLATCMYFGPGTQILTLIFSDPWPSEVIGFIAVWTITLSFQFLLGEIFRGLKEINLAVLLGGGVTATASTGLLCSLLFTENGDSLTAALSMITIAGLANILAGLLILKKRIRSLGQYQPSTSLQKEIFKKGWPLWLNSIAHYILGFSGLWVLGVLATKIDVAEFGAANRLIVLVGMSLIIVNAVIPPLIAGMNTKKDQEILERILRGTATAAAIPSIIFVVILYIFATDIMVFAFGSSYEGSKIILQILLLGHLAGSLSGSCCYLLMMTGHQKTMLSITLIFATASLTISLMIVDQHGSTGIAWVTSTTIITQKLATVYFAHRMTGIWSHFSIRHLNTFIKKDILRA